MIFFFFLFSDFRDPEDEVLRDPPAAARPPHASGANHHQPCDQVTGSSDVITSRAQPRIPFALGSSLSTY